ANGQYVNDKKENLNPQFQGRQTESENYAVGLSKQTTFGLTAKLSYNVTTTQIKGANPQMVPPNRRYEARPSLELSQSLWRNSFGAESEQILAVAAAQADASVATEQFK